MNQTKFTQKWRLILLEGFHSLIDFSINTMDVKWIKPKTLSEDYWPLKRHTRTIDRELVTQSFEIREISRTFQIFLS